MTEVEKKGIGKLGIGIALCAIVIILAATNLWSYTTLRNQIDTLNDEKVSLQNQIDTLNTDKDNLQSQIDSLNDDKNALQSQIDSLQNDIANMQVADMRALLKDQFTNMIFGTDKHRVEGYILNLGEETAYNVKIHLTWDLGGGTYVFKTIDVGNPWGRYIGMVSQEFRFEGQGTLSYHITWD